MDIAFTIVVWAALAGLTVYGLRLVDLLEQEADATGDDQAPATAERERVLVG